MIIGGFYQPEARGRETRISVKGMDRGHVQCRRSHSQTLILADDGVPVRRHF